MLANAAAARSLALSTSEAFHTNRSGNDWTIAGSDASDVLYGPGEGAPD